jgi:uncharacterized membrane protein AbrB (regulator of aidB expression)
VNPRARVATVALAARRAARSRPALWALGAVAAAVLTLALLVLFERYFAFFAAVVVLGTLAAMYFLPSIIAAFRHVPNLNGVLIVNALVGWTFIGWIIALVMACAQTPSIVYAQPRREIR